MKPRWVISEYALLSWREGRIELVAAASGVGFVSEEFELVRLLHAFAKPRTIPEVLEALAPSLPAQTSLRIHDLIRAGMLVPAAESEPAAVHRWNPYALALHRASRRESTDAKSIPSARAATPRMRAAAIPLLRGGVKCGHDLLDVLEARRSVRAWSTRTLEFETFSHLLWSCARNREPSNGAPVDPFSRAYPSGGAVYSLEIYPVLAPEAVRKLTAGVYRYQPARHALEPIALDAPEARTFLNAAGRAADAEAIPPIVLVITSRFARQGEHYGALAYSLILKEVGCLLQTLYLVGTYLQLGVCALGGGTPSARLAHLCATTELAEPVVGELLVGPADPVVT